MNKKIGKARVRKNFQQARWEEPIIHELSNPGVRGIIPLRVDPQIDSRTDNVLDNLGSMRRTISPELPEVEQKTVLSHWLRLSQETMGSNIGNDISEGTCTMKYNPRINEDLASNPLFTDLHPMQDDDTVQGMLEIYYKFQNFMKEVSGMDHCSVQPGGGNHAVYTAASMVRQYWDKKGELDQRDEIITTIFSHPSDAATPATAGFKIITIYPDENGIPDIEAIKNAASNRTAAIFMTNPEDIGIYNPNVDKIVEIIHNVGGLCFYDQANANAFLGVARAREAGFDMCHFNVHKTFGTPHGCSGPGTGAFCCTDKMYNYMPTPLVNFDNEKYFLDYDVPDTIGHIRDYVGVSGVVLKAYAWVMSMGPDYMRQAADISVINNNYLEKKILAIKGITSAFQNNGITRQEQVRYSFENLYKDTECGTDDVNARIVDYGIPSYWTSHHPYVIPEPMTLEPCEMYSIGDLEEYAAVLQAIVIEAYEDPEILKNAPYHSSSHRRNAVEELDNPDKWATTWRAYKRKILDK